VAYIHVSRQRPCEAPVLLVLSWELNQGQCILRRSPALCPYLANTILVVLIPYDCMKQLADSLDMVHTPHSVTLLHVVSSISIHIRVFFCF
jgi:hypothetical protein